MCEKEKEGHIDDRPCFVVLVCFKSFCGIFPDDAHDFILICTTPFPKVKTIKITLAYVCYNSDTKLNLCDDL